jgi:holliday junction DNA helicase RuvA
VISAIHGKLEGSGPGYVLVRTGGFTIKVSVPTPVVDRLGTIGSAVDLYTHLHVREDILALYGFSSDEELSLFESLISVSGIGPKLGLSVLSSISPEEVAMAIASGNPDTLMGIPGIGKKTAGRIVLELKGKIEKQWHTERSPLSAESSEVLAALVALGYSASEALQAAAHVPADSNVPLEERVRQALQYLGRE